MLFSTEPVIGPRLTLSCCALLTGVKEGLGLTQGHTAGGGSKGFRPPDSVLAASQHSTAQTGQSACLAEVLVYRSEFLLMNKSQKPALE